MLGLGCADSVLVRREAGRGRSAEVRLARSGDDPVSERDNDRSVRLRASRDERRGGATAVVGRALLAAVCGMWNVRGQGAVGELEAPIA